MAVKALYDYTFPAADRPELFGDDQLVYIHWIGNPLFCAAAAVRVPKDMPFGTFVSDVVAPWASTDPDFDPASITGWRLFDAEITPDDATPLVDVGISHKSLVKFTTSA